MSGNATEIGTENFDVIDPTYLAKTRIKIPPSNMNTYVAPGSPKPMKEIRQDNNETITASMINLSHRLTGTNNSPTFLDSHEIKNEQNGTLGNNMDENMKDAHIKFLDRRVKLLQAKLRQLDGIEKRFEGIMKEKELSQDELHRAREQFKTLSQDKERLLMTNDQMNHKIIQLQHFIRQNSGKFDLKSNDDPGEKARMYEEIDKLRMENSSLKKSIDGLTSERSSLRVSLSAYENSQSSSGGSSSSMSAQGCTKELENLHQVVDALKSTVLMQRNFLLKLKTPQSTPTQGLEPKGLAKAVTNQGPMAFSQDLPPFRQGEEGSESPLPGLKMLMEPINCGANDVSFGTYSKPTLGVESHATDRILPSSLSEVSSRSHELMMNLPGIDPSATHFRPVHGVHTNAYSENADGMDRLNSPRYGAINLLHKNHNDLYLDSRSNSPNVPQNEDMKSTSPKRGSPKAEERPKREIQPREPARKLSQSEILYRRPTPQNLPTRSKTETLGYNPRVKSKLQSEAEPVWRQPPPPPPCRTAPFHQQAVSQGRGEVPLLRPEVHMQQPVRLDQMSMHPPVQSSHYCMPQGWDLYSNSPAAGINMVAKGVPRTGMPLSEAVNSPDISQYRTAKSPPSYSQNVGHNSDRLCPVCHRDFGSVTIEQFQSHILDCFDNENGPETLLTEDAGPQRICPMCNTSFGDGMSQTEYEKHVHSHFGEDPGENFELLQP